MSGYRCIMLEGTSKYSRAVERVAEWFWILVTKGVIAAAFRSATSTDTPVVAYER
jgi:hypothetical protein